MLDELTSSDLEFDQTAMIDLDQQAECAFCYTEPAPRGRHNQVDLATWAATKAIHAGSYLRSAKMTLEASRLDLEATTASKSKIDLASVEASCLACDSQLSLAVVLPDQLWIPLMCNLSEVQKAFLETNAPVQICDICRNSPLAELENDETFTNRLINRRFGGDELAFKNSAAASTVLAIASILRQLRLAKGA